MTVIAAFPKRSLQLSAGTKSGGWAGSPFGIAVAVLWLAWLFVYEIRPLWDEYRLHKTGALATASEVSHLDRYNSRYNNNVDFDLRYVTQDGISHQTHVQFDSSWDLDDMLLPLEVRYDPDSPQHVSTSYGADHLVARTIHVAFWSTLPAGWIYFAALFLYWKARDGKRMSLQLDAIAAQATAVQAILTNAKKIDKESVAITYCWKDSLGRLLNGSGQFGSDDSPFWLDTARTKMLALVGPNGESLVLDSGLTRVDLNDQERQSLNVARIESLNLSPAAAGELMNKPIGSVVAESPAAAPTAAEAAAQATEAAKKEIKGGYIYSTQGRLLANAAAASVSGRTGIEKFYRYFFLSGIAAAVIAVAALVVYGHQPRAPEAHSYEPFNLADGAAPRTSHVELTATVDPRLAIARLYSGSSSMESYIPLLPPHWHHGDPVVYFLRTDSDYSQISQSVPIRQDGEMIRDALPSDIASEFVRRGIKVAASPMVFESAETYVDPRGDGFLAAALIAGIYAFTAIFTFASVRWAARAIPKNPEQAS
jgi:hypothetical protein